MIRSQGGLNRFMGGYFMDLKISDWQPQIENIEMKIGIDITEVLFVKFGVKSMY